MRDESLDAELPDKIDPDPYYDKLVREAEVEFDRIEAMTTADARKVIAKLREDSLACYKKHKKTQDKQRQRYLDMLGHVILWNPRSENLKMLQQFMKEQLEESLRGDCTPFNMSRSKQTPKQWLEEERARAKEALWIAIERRQKNIDDAREATKWLTDLRQIPSTAK